MESAVEEVFEVQSFQPFHGWVFERFCDRGGSTLRLLTSAAANLGSDDDDRLNTLDEKHVTTEVDTIPPEWMWSHPWQPDVEYTQCDEEGWTYGSSVERINQRLASGTSKCKRDYYHFVRRRRWIRTRVKRPPSETRLLTDESPDKASPSPDDDTDLTPKLYYRTHSDSFLSYLQLPPTSRKAEHYETVHVNGEDIQMEGWLGLRRSLSRSWKLRYFYLRLDTSSLVCLKDATSLVEIREDLIDRHTTLQVEESTNPHQFQFLVVKGDHKLRLNAVDARTRSEWLSAISELIIRSRESFFAEDSESSSSHGFFRSRTLRRLRSSTATDEGSIVAPADNTNTECGHRHHRAWRPYHLVSATMYPKGVVNEDFQNDFLRSFERDMEAAIDAVTSVVLSNLDILEDSLVSTAQMLSGNAHTPRDEIEQLRVRTKSSSAVFRVKLANLMERDPKPCVLQCNSLKKELFDEAMDAHNSMIGLAPSSVHATIKKVFVESPTKRRIPPDWFTSSPKEVSVSRSSRSAPNNLSAILTAAGGSLEKKKAYRTTSLLDNARPVSTSSNGPAGESIRIRTYHEIPQTLRDGHLELPRGVNGYVVRVSDKDLGSLIAFTLTSKAYVEQLEGYLGNTIDVPSDLRLEETLRSDEAIQNAKRGSRHATYEFPGSEARKEQYLSQISSSELQHTDSKFFFEENAVQRDVQVVSFFAAQFHALRALIEPGNLEFLNSLSMSRAWEVTGGKSGALFSKTLDKRYLLKGISATEFNMFLHMAPHYFKFMARVLAQDTPTVLSKVLGLFKITQGRKGGKRVTYVVVMENLAYGFQRAQMYDLKGILRRRYNTSSDEESNDESDVESISNAQLTTEKPVLLDGNLAERIPVPVYQKDLDMFEAAVTNDTGFLCYAGVVDYSILMVFEEEKRRVVVGLIDYLHQFDFLKKMESTSKASLMFRNPTVISPISYRRRFLNAMHRYLVGIESDLERRVQRRHTTGLRVRKRKEQPKDADDKERQRGHSLSLVLAKGETHFDHVGNVPHSDGEQLSTSSTDSTTTPWVPDCSTAGR